MERPLEWPEFIEELKRGVAQPGNGFG